MAQFFEGNVELKVDEGNLFSNKKINLIYGKFLRKLIHKTNMKILAYKQPFDVIKVDYAKIIDDLQKTRISVDVQENKGCKKTNDNINFGLLEKSKKAQSSHIFNSLREASFYQHLCGGIKIFHQSRRRRAMVGG